MPEGEQRIEVLEDEMKVLKGEVSRTLIDLRALLMREDSPLMTGGLLKRIAGSDGASVGVTTQVNLAPAGDPPVSNVVITAPAAPESALAGLPGLGGIAAPEPPGSPEGSAMPSPGGESSIPPAAPPVAAAPPPSAPPAGNSSPPEPTPRPDSQWEEERDEERARQRRTRLQEQEAEEETQRTQRARRRESERAEEETDRDRRNRRREQERGEDEDRERRNRRRQDDDDGHGRERRSSQYDAELEDELERFRRVRRRGEELEEEMERFSESRMSGDDLEDGADAESGGDLLDQEAEENGGPMGLDAGEADIDDAEYDGDNPDDRSGGYLPSTGIDQDPEDDLAPRSDLESGSEDEIDDEYAVTRGNAYSDNRDDGWDYPPELSPPESSPPESSPSERRPMNDFDSYEYQEEPKINGNSGSRRPKRPDADRRAYEDNNYEDKYYDDRKQEYGRGAQNAPRPQRPPRPPADGRGGPRGYRPAPGDYGYAPNAGRGQWGQWGQPPAGYERWPAPQEWAPDASPMDLNLVSSLVRWASLAKHRVGEKRLADIIELYVESRSAPQGLKEALTHIASIVDDQPPESGQTAQETLDLIAHLHGILTAALPVPEVPKIHSNISFVAGARASRGNGDGDW